MKRTYCQHNVSGDLSGNKVEHQNVWESWIHGNKTKLQTKTALTKEELNIVTKIKRLMDGWCGLNSSQWLKTSRNVKSFGLPVQRTEAFMLRCQMVHKILMVRWWRLLVADMWACIHFPCFGTQHMYQRRVWWCSWRRIWRPRTHQYRCVSFGSASMDLFHKLCRCCSWNMCVRTCVCVLLALLGQHSGALNYYNLLA